MRGGIVTTEGIATALQRLQSILRRRPTAAVTSDSAALSIWQGGGGRVATRPVHGSPILTDLPEALGGTGEHVTPGWLLRAGLTACLTTSIVMTAALAGIELTGLEVEATSRSDVRGLFGMHDAKGRSISPGPLGVGLTVRIAAHQASAAQLRALVEDSRRCSPVFAALVEPVGIEMRVEARDT
jgi:uncharacterized OsmC-like protein